MAKHAEQSGMLLMVCDMCLLERGLATGQLRWCAANGTGRTESGECTVRDGVRVGCFPDLHTALSGSVPDR